MAQQIGAKIGVDGEAEFKRSLGNIAAEAKALKAEMTALKTATGEEADEQERAQLIAEKLNEQIENQKERVRLLTEKLNESKAATGDTSTQTSRYREQLANAQTVLNGMLADQQAMTTATTEFGNAEEEAGNKASLAGEMIKANLTSDAIKAGLKAIAKLAKKVAEAFIGAATDAAAYADEILTMSTVTGLSTEQLQELTYMSELIDVDVSTVTGSLKKLTQTMNNARNGTKTSVAAFSRLGVSVTNADGSLRDSNVVFGEVLDALAAMEEGAERDAIMMEIFGKNATELNPLLTAGADSMAAYAEEARRMGYILDDQTLESLASLDDTLVRFENLKQSLRIRLGAAIAPALERIIDKLLDFAQRVDWEKLGEQLGGFLERVTDAVIGFVESGSMQKVFDWIDRWIIGSYVAPSQEGTPGYNATVAAGGPVTNYEEAVREYARLMQALQDLQDQNLHPTQDYEESSEILAAMSTLLNDWDQYGDLEADAEALGTDVGEAFDSGVAAAVDANAWQISDAATRAVKALFTTSPFAIPGLSYDLGDALGGATGGSAGVNYGGVSVQIYGAEGQSASDLYDEFSYRMQQDVLRREAVYG